MPASAQSTTDSIDYNMQDCIVFASRTDSKAFGGYCLWIRQAGNLALSRGYEPNNLRSFALAVASKVRHPQPKKFKFVALPPGFENCIDATIDEVAAYRRESRWTVHRKLREGIYRSYLDGRVHKIVLESVRLDRERAMATGAALRMRSPNPHVDAAPTGKRPPGRPRHL